MAALPHRQPISAQATELTPAMMQSVSVKAGFFHTLRRFFVWLLAALRFFSASFWDCLNGRDSEAPRAVRLRRILEKSGGGFKKIGRLLAMRLDLLPWAYCVELSKIVDSMPPFPIDQVIERVELATGKPLPQTFEKFDPEPIFSDTMTCVYQAIFLDGRKVVVKVRRPKVGVMLAAELRSLDWLLKIGEFFSFIRLESTKNVYSALQETVADELNFTFEARNQILFRSEAKKTKKKFFTSPKIFFELCSQDVIVQEFTEGMWLWELLRAVEQNDPASLQRAEELNIDPAVVAKRLMWVNFWGLDEHLLFIADLHPDSVIVRRDSKLTFLDFSHIGSLSRENRQALQQMMYYAWKHDPLEMARSSMILLEPLPPIDTIKFTKDLEENYWKFIYAMESKRVEWWERTSARLWLSFIRVAREHHVVMNVQVLRMIRACLLYDMIAVRLDDSADHVREYQRYNKHRAKFARRRVQKQISSFFEQGVSNRLFLQMESISDTGGRLFRQLQRYLSTPVMKFNAVLDKPVYSIYTLFKFIWQVVLVGVFSACVIFGLEWLRQGQPLSFSEVIDQVMSNRYVYAAVLLLLIVNVRSVIFRLSDKEM
jgi:ubiquinone biosynthesis protein